MARKRACEKLSFELLSRSMGEAEEGYSRMEADGSDAAFRRDLLQKVRQICDTQLTQKQRSCLLQYYFHGKTIYDIAHEMDVCPSTVSRHLKKAVQRVQNVLQYLPLR